MSAPQNLDSRVLQAHPLPRIGAGTDKDTRGRVLLIAGSASSPGAALLAGEAALRGGAGKVVLATARSIALALGAAAPEFGLISLAQTADGEPDANDRGVDGGAEHCDALLLGPGLMNKENTRQLALRILKTAPVPLVLDAAAITALHDHFDSVRAGNQARILTPHAGEMASLMGVSKDEVERSPQAMALTGARALDSILVLKGAVTYIATPGGNLWKNTGGASGLATAGSGDTLAGLIAALLARGAAPLHACLWGVFIHAQAGARLSQEVGRLGFLARELPRQFPPLLQQYDAQ
ncbi:MAG: NAD(P)H-hydrate dehydratase [Pseudomonadota bacterium]|nr:NAD(P)H-hydrate dehydratase [Pseudomonadota bacterium]